jgi:hypothetical protein
MKENRKIVGWLLLASWVAVLAGFPLPCQGALDDCVTLPFYDSFEPYELNVVDPGPWQYLSSGVTAKVSDAKPNDWWPRSGENSLYVEGSSGWARTEYVELCSTPQQLSYEASVHIPVESHGNVQLGFMYWDPVYPNQIPFANKFRFKPRSETTGEIWWRGNDQEDPVRVLGEYDLLENDVFRLRAEIDFATETADVFVFFVETGEWEYLFGVEATSNPFMYRGSYEITPYRFGVGASGMSDEDWQNVGAYVDDVFITPEPATMLILGLGGLGILRRWRRAV